MSEQSSWQSWTSHRPGGWIRESPWKAEERTTKEVTHIGPHDVFMTASLRSHLRGNYDCANINDCDKLKWRILNECFLIQRLLFFRLLHNKCTINLKQDYIYKRTDKVASNQRIEKSNLFPSHPQCLDQRIIMKKTNCLATYGILCTEFSFIVEHLWSLKTSALSYLMIPFTNRFCVINCCEIGCVIVLYRKIALLFQPNHSLFLMPSRSPFGLMLLQLLRRSFHVDFWACEVMFSAK